MICTAHRVLAGLALPCCHYPHDCDGNVCSITANRELLLSLPAGFIERSKLQRRRRALSDLSRFTMLQDESPQLVVDSARDVGWGLRPQRKMCRESNACVRELVRICGFASCAGRSWVESLFEGEREWAGCCSRVITKQAHPIRIHITKQIRNQNKAMWTKKRAI